MEIENRYKVPNLERALLIIEYLAKQTEGAGITAIAESLEFPKNSVFRILKTLLGHGYVVEEGNRYELSSKLLALGYASLGESTLVGKASDVMIDLRDETHETVVLGKLSHNQGLTLHVVLSDEPIKFVVDVGHHFHLHTSAPGKVLAAHLPESDRDRLLDELEYPVYTKSTVSSRKEMEREISLVRERGYGLDVEEKVLGVHCVAAPIFNYTKENIAALWITGPSSRMPKSDFKRLGKLVVEHALRISKRLGYDPDILEEVPAAPAR